MPIIQAVKNYSAPHEVMLNLFPDQFMSDDDKQKDEWIKVNMDYWSTAALAQYTGNKKKIVPNYRLLNGQLTAEDYYQQPPEVRSLVDMLMADIDLPSYVQHYPILNSPINQMSGEMTKRPDNARVKAMDQDSQNEELAYYTELYQQLVYQEARQGIIRKLKQRGDDTASLEEFQQQVEQLTADKIKDYMTSYTSTAEKWGNRVLTVLKVELNMKEKSEEGFKDLLIAGREFFHVYQDKSRMGLATDVLNPKNVWYLTTPDKKYIRDAYAAGIIETMELSEILNKFDLTIEEIDHLRNKAQESAFPFVRESNLVKSNPPTGPNSVTYDVYDPLVLETRQRMESMLNQQDQQSLDTFLGNVTPNVSTFGNRFIVVRSYWLSKKKIGLLTYIDKDDVEQSEYVDEHYKTGDHPGEIDLKWGYVNQWYEGVKIGDDVYYAKPYDLLDYCPIIGVVHNGKNAEPKSLVDLMKPFQIIYNICINQLYRLLEREKGNVLLMNPRHIPIPKDGDAEDALDIWEQEAFERGVVFVDDSPETTGGRSGFNQFTNIDLSLSNQMQMRYNLAAQIKSECWELVGLTRQRLGSTMATETATATNTALTQSYAQTEPYFAQHEYVMNQLYQAQLDAALVLESEKEDSTLSYVDDPGGNAFIRINGSELKLRDLKVFVTSRAEDQRIFSELRALAQPMLQNGASVYDISVLYTTNSVRQMQDIFKSLKQKQEEMQNAAQQQQQAEIEQKGQIAQAELEQEERHHQDDMSIKKYEIDTRANTEVTKARLNIFFQNAGTDSDQSGVADPLEIAAQWMEQQKMIQDRDHNLAKLALDERKQDSAEIKEAQDRKLKERELDIKEKDIESKERIAKENKGKYDKK